MVTPVCWKSAPWLWFVLAALVLAPPLSAGPVTWVPGGDGPALTLELGPEPVKRTYALPSGADTLVLTLRPFLSPNDRITVTWKADGEFWMRQGKKIPGAGATDRVLLPPGRKITLEVATFDGLLLATITLRRN